jgi:hypothetical protein
MHNLIRRKIDAFNSKARASLTDSTTTTFDLAPLTFVAVWP